MKKKLLVLAATLGITVLSLALPAFAAPPQCNCVYCTLNGGTTNCTIVTSSGYTIVTCGYYYPHYCEGPS